MNYILKFHKVLIILFIVTASFSAKPQSIADTTVFTFVELMPRYPGGDYSMHHFISRMLQYPDAAIENNITGKVYVSVTIEADGSLSNIKVLKGIGSGCDEEALRIVSLMPPWNPGVHDEKNVRVSTTIPIVFQKLQKSDGPIHNNADVLPVFTESLFNFGYFMSAALRYPAGVPRESIVDTVNILYVVETDGSLTNIILKDSKNELNAFDYEAIRVIEKLSGRFKPGYIDDEPVRVRLFVSVVFDYNNIDTLDCKLMTYSYDDSDFIYYKQPDEVFTVVEEMPEYPGGMDMLFKFLGENIRYPAEAKNNHEQGRVFINFV